MRFDLHATTRDAAASYLRERARQTLIDGFRPRSGELELLVEAGVEWGVRLLARGRDGRTYQSIYIYASARGQDHCTRALRANGLPVLTTPGCQLEPDLVAKDLPHVVAARVTGTREYLAIEAHYGERTARRSGVPLIHHIEEGLVILERIGGSPDAMRAYCLHPLVQDDAALAAGIDSLAAHTDSLRVLALAMEYRNIANATLSGHAITSAAIPLSPLDEVNQMLVADKVQNRRDFIRHHRDSHARTTELDRYFARWLERLGIAEARYGELAGELD